MRSRLQRLLGYWNHARISSVGRSTGITAAWTAVRSTLSQRGNAGAAGTSSRGWLPAGPVMSFQPKVGFVHSVLPLIHSWHLSMGFGQWTNNRCVRGITSLLRQSARFGAPSLRAQRAAPLASRVIAVGPAIQISPGLEVLRTQRPWVQIHKACVCPGCVQDVGRCHLQTAQLPHAQVAAAAGSCSVAWLMFVSLSGAQGAEN